MITREEAINLMETKTENINLRRHMLASEAIMRKLAARLEQDADLWGLCGLLHDIDLEAVEMDMQRHARLAVEWLEGKLPQDAIQSILRHNAEGLGLKRETVLDHALAAAENLTGLVVATTLVLPDKKIKDLKAKSVLKRMKEPRFAASVNREIIKECQQIGLELKEFVELGVEAMREIGAELGLY
jgi:putative nucleotidyltransferase with HDIG domain